MQVYAITVCAYSAIDKDYQFRNGGWLVPESRREIVRDAARKVQGGKVKVLAACVDPRRRSGRTTPYVATVAKDLGAAGLFATHKGVWLNKPYRSPSRQLPAGGDECHPVPIFARLD